MTKEIISSDTGFSEPLAEAFQNDLMAVFNLMQEDVLKIIKEGKSPEDVIDKIEKLLG